MDPLIDMYIYIFIVHIYIIIDALSILELCIMFCSSFHVLRRGFIETEMFNKWIDVCFQENSFEIPS